MDTHTLTHLPQIQDHKQLFSQNKKNDETKQNTNIPTKASKSHNLTLSSLSDTVYLVKFLVQQHELILNLTDTFRILCYPVCVF